MPEENPQGVKEVVTESPSVTPTVMTVEPPAESIGTAKAAEGHVPYLRFKEVNDKMRSYEAELAKLRSTTGDDTKPKAVTSVDDNDNPTDATDGNEDDEMSKYERRLTEQGLDPKASKALSKVMKEVAKDVARGREEKAREKAESRLAKEKDRLAKSQREIAEWQTEFRKAHTDYEQYEPKMKEKWESLDEGAKMALVSSSKSYELLYDAVKGKEVESARAEGEDKGREEAYGNQSLKRSISSTPGTTANPGKKFTADDVGKMSASEYKENRGKIMKDLGLQK